MIELLYFSLGSRSVELKFASTRQRIRDGTFCLRSPHRGFQAIKQNWRMPTSRIRLQVNCFTVLGPFRRVHRSFLLRPRPRDQPYKPITTRRKKTFKLTAAWGSREFDWHSRIADQKYWQQISAAKLFGRQIDFCYSGRQSSIVGLQRERIMDFKDTAEEATFRSEVAAVSKQRTD